MKYTLEEKVREASNYVQGIVEILDEKYELSKKYVIPLSDYIYRSGLNSVKSADWAKVTSSSRIRSNYDLIQGTLDTFPHLQDENKGTEDYAVRALDTMCTTYFWSIVFMEYMTDLVKQRVIEVFIRKDVHPIHTIKLSNEVNMSALYTAESMDFVAARMTPKHLDTCFYYTWAADFSRSGKTSTEFGRLVNSNELFHVERNIERGYKTPLYTKLIQAEIASCIPKGNYVNYTLTDISSPFPSSEDRRRAIRTISIYKDKELIYEINSEFAHTVDGVLVPERNIYYAEVPEEEVVKMLHVEAYESRGDYGQSFTWASVDRQVKKAVYYKHYKGGIYKFIATAIGTENEGSYAIYQDENGNVWSRPSSHFFSDVKGTTTPRFTVLPDIEKTDYLMKKFSQD